MRWLLSNLRTTWVSPKAEPPAGQKDEDRIRDGNPDLAIENWLRPEAGSLERWLDLNA
jgi:hypothetical protein